MQEIIANDTQLSALWRHDGVNGMGAEIPVPTATDAMTRKPSDLPDGTISDVNLADILDRTDRLIYQRGLKKMGVSEAILAKIKSFNGMELSGGQFLAASFQLSHQLYFLQILKLDERIDALIKTLEDDEKETDPKKKMSHFDRVFYFKAYAGLISESARGYRLHQSGTESMVNMLRSGTPDPRTGGGRKKPGWGASQRPPIDIPPAQPPPDGPP